MKTSPTPPSPRSPIRTSSRRSFLGTLRTTGLAGASLPWIVSGKDSAASKLRHASIGCGGMGYRDILSFEKHPAFELVAVADVDGAQFAKVKERFPKVRVYGDWRKLLDKEKDIMSVNVSTPDHMHAPITMTAMQRGLHVYSQKPLTRTLHDCRRVGEVAAEKDVVTQMGIQVSSSFYERLAVIMARSGLIGKISEVHSFSHKTYGSPEPLGERADPVPETLHWDHWIGVGRDCPYIDGAYHQHSWRKRIDFGTGTLGDMGCHMFSGWYRGLELTAPTSVKASCEKPEGRSWSRDVRVVWTFPGTRHTTDVLKVHWSDGRHLPPAELTALIPEGRRVPRQGSIYVGEHGILLAPHQSRPEFFGTDEVFKYPKLEARNHYLEFLDAVLGKGPKPSASFDTYSAPMTECVLLGCLASRFPGKELQWDSKALKVNDAEAQAYVGEAYREGWEVEGIS